MLMSKSKFFSFTFFVIILVTPFARAATAPTDCGSVVANITQSADQSPIKPIQTACVLGARYKMKYLSGKISLSSLGHTWILEKIPKRFDPELVGTDTLIGFLPPSLQIYEKRNIVLYISSIRTSGGNGGGQCGSGSEIFLNVLDLSRTRPQMIARHLIESCEKSISIRNSSQAGKSQSLGDITTSNGKLVITYGFHRDYDDAPIATLSDDFKQLQFVGIKLPERIPE